MALQNLQQLHEAALEKRNVAREHCALPRNRLSELGYESAQLREKLAKLRYDCGSLAVSVASQSVENDERRQHKHLMATLPKQQLLRRLEQALYQPGEGAMTRSITVATDTVKRLRFQWCLQVFAMFRLDVPKVEAQQPHERHKHARGVGKIGGLPVPHAGVELYGVLPPAELQSALRLVAGLTCTLAQCLGIPLPHPILLQPSSLHLDIIDHVSSQEESRGEPAATSASSAAAVAKERPHRSANSTAASTAESFLALMDTTTWGRSAKTALQRATGAAPSSSSNTSKPTAQPARKKETASPAALQPPPSMDASAVSQRLLHATAAVLAEDGSATAASFALLPSASSGDSFGIGLQLLQNDIVALCIRVGVPVDALWPAGALLLNLKALMIYCAQQVLHCDDDDE